MARAKKEKTTKKKTKPEADVIAEVGRGRGLEAFGVMGMTMAGVLMFALISFDPTDHSGHSNMVAHRVRIVGF